MRSNRVTSPAMTISTRTLVLALIRTHRHPTVFATEHLPSGLARNSRINSVLASSEWRGLGP